MFSIISKTHLAIILLFFIIISYFYVITNNNLQKKYMHIDALNTIYKYYNISTNLKIYRGLNQLIYSLNTNKKIKFLSASIEYNLIDIKNTEISNNIKNVLLNKTIKKEEQFLLISKIISQIDYEIFNIAKKDKLFIRDKYIINTLVYDIPDLSEYIGRLRGKGASILYKNELSEKDTLEIKSYLLEFNIKMKNLEQISSKINDNKSFLELFKSIKIQYKKFNSSIKFLLKNEFSDIHDYFNKGTNVIYSINEYNDLLYSLIKIKLKEEIITEENKIKNLILFSILIIILFVSYTLYSNRDNNFIK